MTDAEILDRIMSGLFRLNESEMVVEYYHKKRKRWYRKRPDRHPISGRWRFRLGPKRRTIYRNKLIWMIAHRRLVPDGWVVDHKDGDNQNDRVENLQLMTRHESDRQGLSDAYNEVADFFDGLAESF